MVKICDNWHVLEGIDQDFLGEVNAVNPMVGIDRRGVLLVDTGPPGSIDQLRKSLKRLNIGISDIKWIILTHHHFDHVGNLREIAGLNPDIAIYAGELDIQYINGEIVPEGGKLDMDEIRKYFPNITNEILEELASGHDDTGQQAELAPLDLIPIKERETKLDIAGGIRVIQTPGHTPGHISVYLPQCKTIIPGDLMMYWKGKFSGPIRSFSSDFGAAMESVRMVSGLEIESMVGYHGTPILENAGSLIKDFLAER